MFYTRDEMSEMTVSLLLAVKYNLLKRVDPKLCLQFPNKTVIIIGVGGGGGGGVSDCQLM